MAVNKDITFQSYEITKSQIYIQYNEPITTEEGEITQDEDSDDESYRPTCDSFDDSDEEETFDKEQPDKNFQPGANLVVFWSCIVTLLKVCRVCFQPVKICKIFQKGTKVMVDVVCKSNHKYSWYSQTNENGRAAGNISIAASIILFERLKEIFQTALMPFVSHITFYKIQKKLVIPAIHRVFVTQHQLLFDDAKEHGKNDLLGDGRCDSPGYNAKYGAYTVMDKKTGTIMDTHVSHIGVTGNSARMELDGLKNVLQSLYENVINISSLTTERHKQVRSFLRKKQKYISHQFDVWHFAKNIKKHLLKASKKKRCSELDPWIKASINHFCGVVQHLKAM